MKEKRISVYDKHNYDYSSYWKDRSYEHFAEVNVLQKIFRKMSGNWFVDIGGSYGRHTPQYVQKFHNCVIVDYSLNALKQAQERLSRAGVKNVNFVAANAYHLPFRDNVFEASMMIRVLHHLEEPDSAFSEISRTSCPGSTFILEFANKFHIKAIIRALLKLDLKFFANTPYEVPTQHAGEGALSEESGLFYNFSPSYIRTHLVSHGICPKRTYSLSFFRIPILKKLLPAPLLNTKERFAQALFSWTQLTPSVIKRCTVTKSDSDTNRSASTISDILCCPKCKAELDFHHGKIHCNTCNFDFMKYGQIFDLRYPFYK